MLDFIKGGLICLAITTGLFLLVAITEPEEPPDEGGDANGPGEDKP